MGSERDEIRHVDEWHEDHGRVIWWAIEFVDHGIEVEVLHYGTPLDGDAPVSEMVWWSEPPTFNDWYEKYGPTALQEKEKEAKDGR